MIGFLKQMVYVVPLPITGKLSNPKADISLQTFVLPSGGKLLTRTGLITPVKQNEKRAVHTVSTARPGIIHVKKFEYVTPKGNSNSIMQGISEILLLDHAVADSGCAGHMTGNKYLSTMTMTMVALCFWHVIPRKGDPKLAVQTRGKIQKASSAQQALVSYISKQNRTNHKDHQNCLLACFLSQEEPKNISQALQDESWVEAMQEELLQFKLQKVWILVDLPSGKKEIGTNDVFWLKYEVGLWGETGKGFVEGGFVSGGVRVTREDDRGVTEGREDVREVFQQRRSGAKRKLSRCGRNQMGNEPTLALPEEADDFVVYYDERSKELEACSNKERRRHSPWMKLFSEYGFEAKYHLGKANVDVVPWNRKKE
ncbi:hypothetical protein Tco_0728656 [Tanacetum coccineum]|uniref:Reverse transcriptase Ty1/copia-type domain-containing protein n=1 Tax=Tanacetum coccineum TaxID=301880 RepID=A0ABQ4YP75_9ASTR